MDTYTNHFIDAEGYEWQRGSFSDPTDANKKLTWKFRPTAQHKDWKSLDKKSKAWDYISDRQMIYWGVDAVKDIV